MILHSKALVWVLSPVLDAVGLEHLRYLRFRRGDEDVLAIDEVHHSLNFDAWMVISAV